MSKKDIVAIAVLSLASAWTSVYAAQPREREERRGRSEIEASKSRESELSGAASAQAGAEAGSEDELRDAAGVGQAPGSQTGPQRGVSERATQFPQQEVREPEEADAERRNLGAWIGFAGVVLALIIFFVYWGARPDYD